MIELLLTTFLGAVSRHLHGRDLLSRPVSVLVFAPSLFLYMDTTTAILCTLSFYGAMLVGFYRYFIAFTGYFGHWDPNGKDLLRKWLVINLHNPHSLMLWGTIMFSICGVLMNVILLAPIAVLHSSWALLFALSGVLLGPAYRFQRHLFVHDGDSIALLQRPELITGAVWGSTLYFAYNSVII